MSKSPSAGYINHKWLKHRKKIKVDEILAVFQDWIAFIKEADETPYSGLEINDLISIIEQERNNIMTGDKVDYSELKKLFTPNGLFRSYRSIMVGCSHSLSRQTGLILQLCFVAK